MTYLEKIKKLVGLRNQSSLANRICAEIVYLDGISKNHGDRYNALIESVLDFLFDRIDLDGVVTRCTVASAEEMLSPMKEIAKQYTALFVSHAHIDMNWMWGYNETASLTVDTFRTVLDLMREYPELTFAQSQASTYEIIEQYAPEMLDEIKQRIREGRWEVTAAEWVEPDKNMPNGESLTRQILQAKKYLSNLLEIPADSICIDFVPDTFGHNASMPEIMCNAGVKYFYHCRGFEGPCLYRFASKSGKSVLAYREYAWYNADIETEKFEAVPEFCQTYGTDTMLCVYGVGDHGGGPSRRDVERILEYRTWPYTPNIRFGTFRAFFEAVERKSAPLPVVDHELNFLFHGCYTTQSRIKMANRISEARMNEAEALTVMASNLADAKFDQARLDRPWRNILFNHFHDILPGSGTVETREYAMGRFQDTLAAVSTTATRAMQAIVRAIDTTSIPFDAESETRSEGGGVGFFQHQDKAFCMPSTERGRGSVRALHLFNPTPYVRDEYTEVVVWDYPYDLQDCEVLDVSGISVPFCVMEKANGYWGHQYITLLVKANIEPYGYTTVVLKPKGSDGHYAVKLFTAEHQDTHITDAPVVLENDLIRATFDRPTMQLTELYDKEADEMLISEPSCYFRLVQENPIYGMTSWRVGPAMAVRNLNATESVRMTGVSQNSLVSMVRYTMKFGSSVLNVEIRLKQDSRVLEWKLNLDWDESAVKKESVPQLNFAVPVSYAKTGNAWYDIPYGMLKRPESSHDVPALSLIGIEGKSDRLVGLLSDSKYGYRYDNGLASVTLVRSAYDPDPYPERGIHDIRLGVVATTVDGLKQASDLFNHPVCYASSGACHTGTLPPASSSLTVAGDVRVSCVKISEDGNGTVVRLYDESGTAQQVTVVSRHEVSAAYLTDTNETVLSELTVTGNRVTVPVEPYTVVTVKMIC